MGDLLPATVSVHHVIASREGRVGFKTATGATMTGTLLGVALPDTKALRRMVRVTYGERSITVPVLDVGPWFEHDSNYVFGGAMPAAEQGSMPPAETNPGTRRVARNKAGIDLFDGTCLALGVSPDQWGLRRVSWEFV